MLELVKEKGALLAKEKVVHKYPYDWKTDQPVMVRYVTLSLPGLSLGRLTRSIFAVWQSDKPVVRKPRYDQGEGPSSARGRQLRACLLSVPPFCSLLALQRPDRLHLSVES